MGYFRMKSVDIVRVREVMGTDASELDEAVSDVLKSAGYRFVNGFYAKGKFEDYSMTQDEMVSYVLEKQRVADKYYTVADVLSTRGYIRGDQEIYTRVRKQTTMKKEIEKGRLMKTSLYPAYIGYALPETASVYRAAKHGELDETLNCSGPTFSSTGRPSTGSWTRL